MAPMLHAQQEPECADQVTRWGHMNNSLTTVSFRCDARTGIQQNEEDASQYGWRWAAKPHHIDENHEALEVLFLVARCEHRSRGCFSLPSSSTAWGCHIRISNYGLADLLGCCSCELLSNKIINAKVLNGVRLLFVRFEEFLPYLTTEASSKFLVSTLQGQVNIGAVTTQQRSHKPGKDVLCTEHPWQEKPDDEDQPSDVVQGDN